MDIRGYMSSYAGAHKLHLNLWEELRDAEAADGFLGSS